MPHDNKPTLHMEPVAWMVGDDASTAAVYNAGEREQAFDAARRWNKSISGLVWIDEVGSNNPLGREAAAILERLRAERDCLKHELAEVRSVLQVTIAARNTYMAERDTLAAIVRAADAIRTVYATGGCECSNCTKAREYDSARANVNTTEGEK